MTLRATIPVDFTLYLITDREQAGGRDLLTAVEAALSGGVNGVQLREKGVAAREYWELASALRSLTSRYGARLLINDRIDIALTVGADGVHLPEAGLPVAVARNLLGPERLIGVSCHSPASARAAEESGADFITFGPVFFTPSKARYGDPVGVEALASVTDALTIPVFPLGGITRERLPELLTAGVRRIACISAILAAPEPGAEAKTLLAELS